MSNNDDTQRARERLGNIQPTSFFQKYRHYIFGGIGVLLLFMIIIIVAIVSMNKKEETINIDNVESQPFFPSYNPEPEPEPEPVIIVRDPPLDADDAFNKKPEPEPEFIPVPKDLSEEERAFNEYANLIWRTRHQNSVVGNFEKSVNRTTNNGSSSTTNRQPQTDKDFSRHGMRKDISTLPVDLSLTITSDRYIPCVLIDQIHSELEGLVTCQVENHVFGVHGRKILIPAGSRIQGFHGTIDKTGMERFNIEWQRIFRPDGRHILLTDAYASDAIGQAGVTGDVDHRWFDKYGSAIITATMSTMAQIAMTKQMESQSSTQIMVENFGTDLGQVTEAMLKDVVNIKPFAIVPSGTRLMIRPSVDIWLRETADNQLVFGTTK